jgi:hypothetical protein
MSITAGKELSTCNSPGHICIYVNIYMYVFVIYVLTYSMYICMYVCVYVCIYYVRIYVCMCNLYKHAMPELVYVSALT